MPGRLAQFVPLSLSIKIQHSLQEALPLPVLGQVMFAVLVVIVVMIAIVLLRQAMRLRRGGTLNDLIEFPAVQPHSAALGSVVDLDSLPVHHV